MKCGGLRLGETDRNRNVEVERTISFGDECSRYFGALFLCPATFLGKHPHDVKPFALTQIWSKTHPAVFLADFYS